MAFKKQYNLKELLKTLEKVSPAKAEIMRKILPAGLTSLSPKNTGFLFQQATTARTQPILLKELPDPIQKTERHIPKITNGRISFEEFARYVSNCADDRNQYFDELRLKTLLTKSTWRSMRVTDNPLTLTPTIIARVSEILTAI